MVNFEAIDPSTFLNEYWQKKPLIIRQALPDFINPLSGDELAGLSFEENIESRLVFETPSIEPSWQVKSGPFNDSDFNHLPKTHWTLLVQGVDRFIPDVAALLDHFNFIPHWRLDDVMISYAVKQGSVGPHYDNYDVFLYQAAGRRKWTLTTKNCNTENYLKDVPLRIMDKFEIEEEYILEPGDMLYLPPHIGHHGVSLSNDCMTYSFGYRSYQGQELWDSLGDFLSEQGAVTALYKDPIFKNDHKPALIPKQSWEHARKLLIQMLSNDQQIKTWFGCFATTIDQQAEQQLPMPIKQEGFLKRSEFIEELNVCDGLSRDSACRFAYSDDPMQLFINGCIWDIEEVSFDLVTYIANNRLILKSTLDKYISQEANQIFLYELWKLQWLLFLN